MATISYEMPPSAFAALHLSPKEFAREMQIAACVQWYAQGLVSQERAAEIVGPLLTFQKRFSPVS